MKNIYPVILILLFASLSAKGQVVINEVYGGGGNSGSTYKNDFIELYNNGTSDIALDGWSVQYASSTGTTWQVTTLSGTIPAKGYYLIQEAQGSGGTTSLPTPNATGNISMSATTGKVALVNTTTALTGACPTGANIIDFVGFGTANCFEGTAAAPAPSNANSIQRTPLGTDTNNNSADFSAGALSPTNGTAGPDITAPAVSSLYPADNGTNAPTSFNAVITFNEPIAKGSTGTITIRNSTDNSVVQTIDFANSVTVTGSTAVFPVSGLAFNTGYYIDVSNGAFVDLANNSFAGVVSSTTWNFTTIATPPMGVLGTTYSFTTCSNNFPDGFTQYSVSGAITWGCTSFGHDPANATASLPYAVQINGFANGTNVTNVDWFISPAFDLTGTTYPLLSFWSRTAFNGAPLQLKVSTNYSGTGDPNLATWTDLNGKFPANASDVWTLSDNINLAAFKAPKVYIAFVYESTEEEGARWTLDDIMIRNSSTPPPPSLTLNTENILFTYVPSGSTATKTFTLTGNDITGDITITSTGNFNISSNGTTFGNTVTYTVAQANNVEQTVTVQFAPTEANKNYTGTIIVSTSGVADTIYVKGSSIDPAITLEVVNWNIEWFGSPSLGPVDDNLQEQNVKTVLKSIGADIYALAEIVDTARLGNVVRSLPGGYSYVVSNYGSNTNTSAYPASALDAAQKMAFVYKTSMFSNVTTTALLSQGINSAADLTNPAYNYFASGRFPYMMSADVTLNGVTKNVKFVLLHAKANTSPTTTSYDRRKRGADTLHYTFNTLYPNDNIILLGDYNDDLDQTITAGINPPVTSYVSFTTDGTNFMSPTLPLSLQGLRSTTSYNDVIDHVMISNDISPYYMLSSASILTDVTNLVNNYASTTSDHYPVFTRYTFDANILLPVKLLTFTATKENETVKLNWTSGEEVNTREFVVERSTDGQTFNAIGRVSAKGNSTFNNDYAFVDTDPVTGNNIYRLRIVDFDNKYAMSNNVTVSFTARFTFSVSPNPARGRLTLKVSGTSEPLQLLIFDATGKLMQQLAVKQNRQDIDISRLTRGIYLVQLTGPNTSITEKLVVE